jgi:endonuclease/exonuclease/phosphatase family metal-dependent hydrolase
MRLFLIPVILSLAACSSDGDEPDLDLNTDGPGAMDSRPRPDRAPADITADVDTGGDAALPDGGPADSFRVATFNCYCLKSSPDLRIKGIADEIDRLKLDAVGLQEVCQSIGSGGSDNLAAALAAELQALTGRAWEHRFAKTHVAWSAYDEGVGLLAPKGQVLDWGEQSLPQGKGAFPRKVIWAKVGAAAGSFYLYNTHLTISSDPLDREAQAKAVLALVDQHQTPLPQVVVGDFNDWYGSAAVSTFKKGPPAFTDAWGEKHPGSINPGTTCCYPSFKSRIDYIFVKSSALTSLDQVELAFEKPYQGAQLSDHRGLWVRFRK